MTRVAVRRGQQILAAPERGWRGDFVGVNSLVK